MSTARKKSEGGVRTGWFSMLVVGVIVISAGFAVGIVAGVTWEEPGLVIGWLTGENDGIEWSVEERETDEFMVNDDDLPIADVPSVAAAPPPLGGMRPGLGDPTREPGPRPALKPPPAPKAAPARAAKSPEPAPQGAGAGKFSVQVGAFADREGADALSATLREAGYPVYLSDSDQGARWRVRVGPHQSREGAERTAERLKSVQQLPTWVLSDES